VLLAQPNENIMYHNPEVPKLRQEPSSLPIITNEELEELFEKNLDKFEGVKAGERKKGTGEKLVF
jgi:hypothetical protein